MDRDGGKAGRLGQSIGKGLERDSTCTIAHYTDCYSIVDLEVENVGRDLHPVSVSLQSSVSRAPPY